MEWRLDKFLTQIPVGTRSQVKDMIKKGRVCVNGVHASKPELKVDPETVSYTHLLMSTNKNSNRIEVPEAKQALDQFKMEVADELGVPLTNGYNGNLTLSLIHILMIRQCCAIMRILQETIWHIWRRWLIHLILKII